MTTGRWRMAVLGGEGAGHSVMIRRRWHVSVWWPREVSIARRCKVRCPTPTMRMRWPCTVALPSASTLTPAVISVPTSVRLRLDAARPRNRLLVGTVPRVLLVLMRHVGIRHAHGSLREQRLGGRLVRAGEEELPIILRLCRVAWLVHELGHTHRAGLESSNLLREVLEARDDQDRANGAVCQPAGEPLVAVLRRHVVIEDVRD